MARAITAGQPTIIRAGCYDYTAAREMTLITCNGEFVTLSGSTDALPFPGNTLVTTAGVDAMTLATPIAGNQPLGDDGKIVRVIDNNGQAHTITTAANKIINSKHVATFNGTIGSFIELIAMSGVWVPLASSGVTIS